MSCRSQLVSLVSSCYSLSFQFHAFQKALVVRHGNCSSLNIEHWRMPTFPCSCELKFRRRMFKHLWSKRNIVMFFFPVVHVAFLYEVINGTNVSTPVKIHPSWTLPLFSWWHTENFKLTASMSDYGKMLIKKSTAVLKLKIHVARCRMSVHPSCCVTSFWCMCFVLEWMLFWNGIRQPIMATCHC